MYLLVILYAQNVITNSYSNHRETHEEIYPCVPQISILG